jgi:hypothetical protein
MKMRHFKELVWIWWREYFESVIQNRVKILTSTMFSLRTRLFVLGRVLPHNLLVAKLTSMFPIFNKTTAVITVFNQPTLLPYLEPDESGPRHWSLSCGSLIQSIASHLNLYHILLNLLPLTHLSPKLSLLLRVYNKNFVCILRISLFIIDWKAERLSASYKNNVFSRCGFLYTCEY